MMDAETERLMYQHKLEYRGYHIVLKRDFGRHFHLVDGMPCRWGFIVTKGGANALPGAVWCQTVKEAKQCIDCLIETGDTGAFHDLTGLYSRAEARLPQVLEAMMAAERTLAELEIARAAGREVAANIDESLGKLRKEILEITGRYSHELGGDYKAAVLGKPNL